MNWLVVISEPTSVNCAKTSFKRTDVNFHSGLSNVECQTPIGLHESTVFDNLGIVDNEAYQAYWNTMAGNNSLEMDFSHTIVQRASKTRGDGVAFETWMHLLQPTQSQGSEG